MMILWIVFQFFPQSIYMRIDVPLVAFVFGAPNTIEQIIARPRPARLRGQEIENLKLEWREIDSDATARNFVSSSIDDQIAYLHSIFVTACRNGLASPQQRF